MAELTKETKELINEQISSEDEKILKEDSQNIINDLKEAASTIDYQEIIKSKSEDNDNSDMDKVVMNVAVDPNTGETKILGNNCNFDDQRSFDDLVKKINSNDPDILSTKPFSEEELIDIISSKDDETIISELAPDTNLSADAIRELLQVVNRRISREDFNIYKALPLEIQKLVDDYIAAGGDRLRVLNSRSLNTAKNYIAESLVDEFIYDIKSNRAKNDFAREMEQIYSSGVTEISSANMENIEDRNKAFRDLANNIEDEGKKERLNSILDRIEEARNLTELKEFSKTCKIKKIEIEKPSSRVYNTFLNKYKDSYNNIYDIDLAYKVLIRMMEPYNCGPNDINAFLICFCKQVAHFNVENVLDHAYMYYVLYYCVMLDSDRSSVFTDNIYEVICNLRERNKY